MSFMDSIGSAKVTASSHRNETSPWRQASVRSYGLRRTFYQIVAVGCVLLLGAAKPEFAGAQSPAEDPAQSPLHIVALGDSLTAGYGLAVKDGFVPQLRAALAARGIKAEIADAGVSGDTASDGLARLDWSVPEGTDAAIVELGANDMLRGIDPQVTRDALDAIVARLAQRHIAVMLCGMRAAPNLGVDYGRAFERIYPELAAKYGAVLYPFFVDGVAADRAVTQQDGMHPNAAGIAAIVRRILPTVQELIARARAQKPS
jgi:acyl-CoA thioesterase-1